MKKSFYLLLLVLAVVLVGCGDTEKIAEESPSIFSGEDYFAGIFMLQGEVVDKISLYDRISLKEDLLSHPQAAEQLESLTGQIIQKVNMVAPTYFNELANAIESDNHFAIQEQIRRGAKLYTDAVWSMPEFSDALKLAAAEVDDIDLADFYREDGTLDHHLLSQELRNISSEDPSKACSIVAFCVAWIWVAVAQDVAAVLNVAAAINVAAAVAAWVEVVGPEP
ncbi:MAG: hypothetical protein AAFU67_17645, partial [Bacteroidota bacterium]